MKRKPRPVDRSTKATPELATVPPLEEGEVLVFGSPIPLVMKPETLADRIRQAQERSVPRLNTATDKLNAGIVDITRALADLRLGVAAGVPVDNGDPSGRISTTLAFRKHEGAWTLVLDDDDDAAGERMSTTPLIKASREERLQAVQLLPDLVEVLIKRAEEETERVEAGIESLEALSQEIRAGKS